MRIAVGSRRTQKKWVNREISWEDFAARCSHTVRTSESVSEYRRMTRAQQDQIKDVGGFVGGALREGRRKNGYVLCRSMLTLDLDHAAGNLWDEIGTFFDFRCLLYSTHKHTPASPRVRLIVPLSREVTAEEYAPVSRMVARDIGIEMFDDTCHEPARLMYWPSTSSDGEFLFERQDGPLLDPDSVLSRYQDWHDASQWPMSARQSEVVQRALSKQADPLQKKGVVGAFCRTYDIDGAIQTFLSDIYAPSAMPGRYDYIPADSAAGLVLYDGRFAYSHHATDPACGQLLNAFDLVRLHRFAPLDDEAKPDTPSAKLPSYKAMCAFALEDEGVKQTLAGEREAEAKADFALSPEPDPRWQSRLELEKDGSIRETLTNFVEILRHDPRLQEIRYNQHRCGLDVRDPANLPWTPLKSGWSDADLAALSAYLDRVYHVFSPQKLKAALLTAASERAFHPVRDYLRTLPAWDGVPRLDTLLIDYLGAEDLSYNRAVIRKALVAAVARVFEPGVKFDYIPVVSGPQGIGKSTLFSRLGGVFYSDSLTIADMRDKTGAEKLQGCWIIEISEMTGMKKVDVETVKSFASRQDDKFRVAYGSVVESHPRQCVIFGTTNASTGFLRDVTGNRRFWPVSVKGSSPLHPWGLTKETVGQIWAEALFRYRSGEELILTGEEAETAFRMQQDAMESDEREGLVREYLDKLLPEDWARLPLPDRRAFLEGDGFACAGRKGTELRTRVCNLELWAECFGRDPAAIRKQDSYELTAIMNRLPGWTRYTGSRSGKLSFGSYGPQLAWVRSPVEPASDSNTGHSSTGDGCSNGVSSKPGP